MSGLTLFGFAAVFCMMAFDTLEKRHYWWTLGFAAACFCGSAYAVLTHSWPFAIVEAFWGLMKLWHFHTDPRRKWWNER